MKIVMIFLLSVTTLYGGKAERLLLKAMKSGDQQEITTWLEAGADVNYQSGDETLLMCAVEFCDLKLIKSLIDKGARIDATTKKGGALHKAVAMGRVQALRALITAGADANAVDQAERTPLMKACLQKKPRMVDALLQAGARVNLQDANKDTALHFAIKSSHLESVDLLLRHEADHKLTNVWGNTPVEIAVFLKHRPIMLMLQDHGRITVVGQRPVLRPFDRGEITLWTLAGDGALEELKTGLGNRVNESNQQGRTLLMEAATSGSLEVAAYLLSAGAKPDVSSQFGKTALGIAVDRKDAGMVNLLWRHGARVLGSVNGKSIVAGENPKLETLARKLAKKQDTPIIMPPGARATDMARAGDPGVTVPVINNRVPPKYPQAALESKIMGFVILEGVVAPNGELFDISILSGLGNWYYGFEYEAIYSVKKWNFKPGTRNGKPIPVRMNFKIDFVLGSGL